MEKAKKMEKKLLITGFEPFGGEIVNPSWEAVKALPDVIGNFRLVKMRVPVLFGGAARVVLEKAAEVRPDAIICVGQAGGRSKITVEVAALNLRDALMADNGGLMPQDEPVAAGGPAAYFATLPVRKMADAVRACGIPCGLSYSAGVYVCNDLFYMLLYHYEGTRVGVGFIHVPYLPEQAGAEPFRGRRSLAGEDQASGSGGMVREQSEHGSAAGGTSLAESIGGAEDGHHVSCLPLDTIVQGLEAAIGALAEEKD